MIVAQAFAIGFIVGAGFVLFGLPIPAPATLAGLAGVVGLTTAALMARGLGL